MAVVKTDGHTIIPAHASAAEVIALMEAPAQHPRPAIEGARVDFMFIGDTIAPPPAPQGITGVMNAVRAALSGTELGRMYDRQEDALRRQMQRAGVQAQPRLSSGRLRFGGGSKRGRK